ncbi:hypothetical protein JCM10914A_30710 [Paenibacillus sp. JCM 10914]|uniref:hypothetical protein n=1 Tax=Paenibacillus sp. JCM 10914 TaxID=1236974 RepID=UPI00068AAC76|nr:hypothetical protein [Paenibacillus sp. JCM 10914]
MKAVSVVAKRGDDWSGLVTHVGKQKTVFIFDDSMFERNRSKAVELLARFNDHATGTFYKRYRMLTKG